MDIVSGVSITTASIYPDVGVTEAQPRSPGHAGTTALLPRADFVIVTTPHTPETEGIRSLGLILGRSSEKL